MKTLKFLPVSILLLTLASSASFSVEITTYTVDGIFNNPEVVIHGHSPVFSWEYDHAITTFTLNVLRNGTTVGLSIGKSTDSTNTSYLGLGSGYRTIEDYDSLTSIETLLSNTSYTWNITIFIDDGTSAAREGFFVTVISSVSLETLKPDLQVDFNNPFNAAGGQVTKFRYTLNSTRRIKLRIYSLTGEYVLTLAEHYANAGMIYTAEWDGRDHAGNIVPSGIYLVNLDFRESRGVTRKVVVVNK